MFSQRSAAKPKYNNNFERQFYPSNLGLSNRNFPHKKPEHSPFSSSQGKSYSGTPNNFIKAPSSNPGPSNRIPCQICGRVNHQALDCFHRMDYAFQDNVIGRILLQGPIKDGLYPIQLQHFTKNKVKALTAYIGVKVPSLIWHNQLRHPS
jgi:hypothetical protein